MKPAVKILAALSLSVALSAYAADMPGCRGQAASGPAGDCPMAMHKPAHGHGRWGADYTPGWMLMTPPERKAFAEKMRDARSREECQALVAQQRAEIETRAKATGQHLPREPRRRACTSLPHGPMGEGHRPG